jgi:hypothetical protein
MGTMLRVLTAPTIPHMVVFALGRVGDGRNRSEVAMDNGFKFS